MVKHFKGILTISLLLFILLIIIPGSFAHENQTDLQTDSSGEILSDETIDIYFDASVNEDGDGSKQSPYKTIDSSRLRNDSNIYFEEGEYILQSDELNLSNVNIYGKNPEKTIIYAHDSNVDVVNINANGKFSISNITLNSLRFTVDDEFNAYNSNFILHLWYKYDNGGAIYSSPDTFSTINIDRCNFYNYTACSGGAILCDYGILNISNSGFYNNYVFPYQYVLAEGGAILICNSTANIRNSYFKGNSAEYSSGTIYNVYSNTTVYNCTFTDNEAQLGGAMHTFQSNLYVAKSIFKNNKANCGAIYGYMGNVTVTDSIFENNNAKYFGGALCVENTKLILSSSDFKNNSAVSSGGSVYVGYSDDVEITDNTFESDSSNRMGASVYAEFSNVNLNNNKIVNGKSLFGAGICGLYSNMTLNSVSIKNSSAEYYGGAIYSYFGNLKVFDSNLEDNCANKGGALYLNYGLLNIGSTDIINNSAETGNAGYLTNVTVDESEKVLLKNNEFVSSNKFDYFFGNGNYTLMRVNDTFDGNLPARYNSADYGYITPVSDQLNGDYCWAFSTIAVLESCVAKATGLQYDFSENNLINLNKKYSSYGINTTNQAGNAINALGYLLSWLGPVDESDDTYQPNSKISPVLDSIMHVQNVLFVDMKYDDSDRDAIKEAIMRYGAVGTSIYWMQIYPLQNGSSYYHFSDEPALANHAITLVGWDDNYSKDNFGLTPPGDGAWICKNTWGSGIGDKGYFYISYYCNSLNYEFYNVSDEYMNLDWVFSFILNDTIHLDKNYQYDYAGPTDSNILHNGAGLKNVFTATEDEYLAAVSTYFLQNTEYEINIYVNGELVHNQSATSSPGYYTINLDRIIPLKANDTFEVAFRMYGLDDDYFTFYACEKDVVTADIYKQGISYVSYPWQSEEWYDYGEYEIFCIKAFTILNELKTTLSLTAEYNNRNPVNITALVFDEYGRKIAYGNVTFSLEGREFTVNVSDGVAKLTHNFKKGISTITAKYNAFGYISSTDSIDVDVYKEVMDLNLDVSTYLNTATVNISTPEKISSLVEVVVNNDTYMIILMNGKAKLELNDLDNGDNEITASLYDSQLYDAKASKTFVIDVVQPKIQSGDFVTYENSNANYAVRLVDDKSNPVSGKTVSFKINGDTFESTTDSDGVAALTIDLASGMYKITVNFIGDNISLPANSTNTINVKKLLSAAVDVIKDYRNVNVDIALSKKIDMDLKVDVNHITHSVSAKNGQANLKLENLKNGDYNIVVYLEGEDYDFTEVSKDFTINAVETKIISSDMVTIDDNKDTYSVKLLDRYSDPIVGKTVMFNIDGINQQTTTDRNGVALINLNLTGGNYKITASYAGDGFYMPTNSSNDIKVKTNLTSKINVVKKGRSAVISVMLSKDVDVDLILSVNGKNQTLNSKDTLKLNNLSNRDYTVRVYLNSEDYVFESSLSRFYINVLQTRFAANDLVAYVGSDTKFSVKLFDENDEEISGKSVIFNLNGKVLNAGTDKNGIASIPINNLASGSYSVEVIFEESDSYLASSIAKKITVKSTMALPSNGVYTFNSSYQVKLYDKKGNAIKNQGVEFDIAGQTRQVISQNGIAALDIDLAAGNYTIKVINPITGEVKTQDICVMPRLSENKSVTMYYGAGKTYRVRVLDDNGNIAEGAIVTIKIGSVTKKVTAGSAGYATYKITSKPGKYTITATYKGFKVSNKITVKTTLVTKNLSVKKAKTFKFTAKLLNSKGKILKNKQVKFKFNGDTYKIKTDKKGIATLKVTKKLKVGKYTIKTTYGKLTVSNKITIKK